MSDEEEQQVPTRETSVAAVGQVPGQPGKSNTNLSLSDALQDLLGVVTAGSVGPGGTGVQSEGVMPDQQLAGNMPASAGSGTQLSDLLQGLRALLGRCEGGQGQPPQVAPWTAPVSGLVVGGTGGAGVEVPPVTVVPSQAGDGTEKARGKGTTERTDLGRIADAAKCEVYSCFGGPLGAHLKQEVHDKIQKGEYVEIFRCCPWKSLIWIG